MTARLFVVVCSQQPPLQFTRIKNFLEVVTREIGKTFIFIYSLIVLLFLQIVLLIYVLQVSY